MGSREFHLRRASHHLEVAEHLSGTPDYVDWAVVALFYAAHQMVHSALSGEPRLSKDERHPRKHTSHGGPGTGGKGTNQMVRNLYPSAVHVAYRSLYEASLRTRYDMDKLGVGSTLARFRGQFDTVELHCKMLNMTRPDRNTQEP